MTRQEAVIKIVKITRIIGELKYQLDADDEGEFEALDPEWKHIAEWTQEVSGTWNWTLPRRWPV